MEKTDEPQVPRPSDVAEWHRRSGLPDNVTDDGEVVDGARGRRVGSEKDILRGEIETLRSQALPDRAATLVRLAASYLIAGDSETARRYLSAARDTIGR